VFDRRVAKAVAEAVAEAAIASGVARRRAGAQAEQITPLDSPG
jgi:malic enzyme